MVRERKNMFAIALELVMMLISKGILVPIVSLNSRAPKSKDDKMAINGYFRIVGVPNLIWMHVQHGYGIIINEFVTTRQGNKINLVDELSKYYWYIDKEYNNIRCSELNNRTIWRCIGSIILYGDIHQNMPRCLEVHHKWYRWCNTVETIAFICTKEHKFFHNVINSKRSHRTGRALNNYSQAVLFFNQISNAIQWWNAIPM